MKLIQKSLWLLCLSGALSLQAQQQPSLLQSKHLTTGSNHISDNPQDTLPHIAADRHNSTAAQKKPYVILISSDGFRHDYAQKYQLVWWHPVMGTGRATANAQRLYVLDRL